MTEPELPPEFIEFVRRIQSKRPRTVIEHILEYGYITTEELKTVYGYNHPPRAARDVREQGVPLISFRVIGSDGRKISAYKFGDPAEILKDRTGGRKTIPKKIKDRLIKEYGNQCAICLEEYDSAHLQVDHRVPYQVAGDQDSAERLASAYMLLCGSCNRAKSWTCEQCSNWRDLKSVETCASCYWANPTSYEHIAMKTIRRIDIVWSQEETAAFDVIKKLAELDDRTVQDYIKAVLARHLRSQDRQE
ncbi:MAG: HNH endonuclease [Chloroflexi bacterium]|nr:HNH endonuclease [Chloroflexota bacterium]